MKVLTVATAFVASGGVLVSLGAAMVYRPAGVIVAGLILLGLGAEALRQPRGEP